VGPSLLRLCAGERLFSSRADGCSGSGRRERWSRLNLRSGCLAWVVDGEVDQSVNVRLLCKRWPGNVTVMELGCAH